MRLSEKSFTQGDTDSNGWAGFRYDTWSWTVPSKHNSIMPQQPTHTGKMFHKHLLKKNKTWKECFLSWLWSATLTEVTVLRKIARVFNSGEIDSSWFVSFFFNSWSFRHELEVLDYLQVRIIKHFINVICKGIGETLILGKVLWDLGYNLLRNDIAMWQNLNTPI